MKKLLVVLLIATVLGFTAKFAMGAIFGAGKEKISLLKRIRRKASMVK